jgi:hypothetical protein
VTLNVVTVTVAADSSPADPTSAEGNVIAIPDGDRWPDISGNPIVPMVVHATLNDGSSAQPGACTVALVASDNFNSGVLTWDFLINIRGFPTVKAMDIPVNFNSGANQSVWTILAAAGWTP